MYFRRKEIPCLTEEFAEIAEISVADCFEIANLLCREFQAGTFGHIELCYTIFVSMLSQQPEVFSMLPLADLAEDEEESRRKDLILYEPNVQR